MIQEELPMTPLEQRSNTVFTNITNHDRQIATDITGKFLVTSKMGNKYLFILYEHDINIILIRPMKAITDSKLIQVFKDLHGNLLNMGPN